MDTMIGNSPSEVGRVVMKIVLISDITQIMAFI